MKKLTFILGLILIMNSCEDDNYLVNSDYTEYISGTSINTEIDFFPIELYESYNSVNTPDINLIFYTTKIFPYTPNSIITSTFINNNELIIRFDSIIENGCACMPGPAETEIQLTENIDRIALINDTLVDQYLVDITKEYVELKLINKNFTHLRYDKIFRYQENSFLYKCKMDTSEINIYNDFLNILTSNLSIVEINYDGEGLKPNYENWIEYNRQCLTIYFEYESEQEFEKAGELLKDFVAKNNINSNTSVNISLISWNNSKYLSWMFD